MTLLSATPSFPSPTIKLPLFLCRGPALTRACPSPAVRSFPCCSSICVNKTTRTRDTAGSGRSAGQRGAPHPRRTGWAVRSGGRGATSRGGRVRRKSWEGRRMARIEALFSRETLRPGHRDSHLARWGSFLASLLAGLVSAFAAPVHLGSCSSCNGVSIPCACNSRSFHALPGGEAMAFCAPFFVSRAIDSGKGGGYCLPCVAWLLGFCGLFLVSFGGAD